MENNKTAFASFEAISGKTPAWAKWVFRIIFILTTVTTFIIASDPGIPDAVKVRISVYLKGLDMVIYGVSKLFGVVPPDKPDTDNP